MQTGFTFKGIHSGKFGIVMKTSSRPIQPELKSCVYDTPLMDGSYDFSAANSYGRAFYKDRTFVIIMQIFAEDIYGLQKKISRISSWLTGRGTLTFDDMPLVTWNASLSTGIDYAPELSGTKAVLTATFDVKPFSEAIFDTQSGVMLDCPLPLDTQMPLDISSYFTFTAPSDVEAINIGTHYVSPVIVFTQNTTGISSIYAECGGKRITVSGLGSSPQKIITIDTQKHTVTGSSLSNLMDHVTGEFPELAPGKNIIECGANVSPCGVQVIYTPLFMYDFVPEDMEVTQDA